MVTVREGDKVLTMPAIHAVLRGPVALADKGNGPAQRTLIETVQAIERELAAQMAIKNKLRPTNLKSPALPRGALRFSSIELRSRREGQRRRATRASCGTPRRSPAWSVRYSFQLQKYCGTTVSVKRPAKRRHHPLARWGSATVTAGRGRANSAPSR
jgi:hypothetical protein